MISMKKCEGFYILTEELSNNNEERYDLKKETAFFKTVSY